MDKEAKEGITTIRESQRQKKGVPPKRYGWEELERRQDQAASSVLDGEDITKDGGKSPIDKCSKSVDNPVHFDEETKSHRSGSRRSIGAISNASIRRQRLQTNLEADIALANLDEKREELELKRIERERTLVERRRALDQAIIDEQIATGEDSEQSGISDIVSDINNIGISKNQPSLNEFSKNIDDWIHEQSMTDPMDKLTNALAQAIQRSTTIATQNMKHNANKDDDMKFFIARQSNAKDLPIFSGHPEDWTNFICQYKRSTDICGFTDEENVYRLQRCLKGKALEAVQAMLVTPDNLNEIIATLETTFGRPEYVVKILIDKVSKMSNVREEKLEMIIELSNAVKNLVVTMESLHCTGHLNNPLLLEGLVGKLPPSLRLRWGEKAATVTDANLKQYSEWMSMMAKAASFVSTPVFNDDRNRDSFKKDKKKVAYRDTVLATTNDNSKSKKKEQICIHCKKENHEITDCKGFLKLDVDEKWKWITEQNICFSCLKAGHRMFRCFKKTLCGKDDCRRQHHPLLHKPENSREEPEKTEVVANTFQHEKQSTVLLRIAQVRIRGPLGEISTYALFDEASTVTLLDESVAQKIGATGPQDTLNLRWTNADMRQELKSNRVTVEIRAPHEDERFKLVNVRTVKNLDLPLQSVNVKKFSEQWKYLSNMEIDSFKDAKPTILIGQDNIGLIIAREVVEGPKNGPIASRTKLGWIIHGNVSSFRNRIDDEFTMHIYDQDNDLLHQLVKDSFKTDTFGVQVLKNRPMSKDDIRAQKLSDETARQIGDRWEVGLLWKESVNLPFSKANAANRLRSTEKKMDQDPKFAQQYCDKIQDYLTKSYARKLSQDEIATTNKTWYLPHFAVVNPNKPGKFRMVFDAAAKSKGVSLNDALLKGPDLLNSLVSVLFKFRQREIGFCADIREMFHQVNIRREDSSAQRFLWRGTDRHREPDVYEMNVMIFGAVSSPFQAQEIKNKNARQYEEEFPEATEAVIHRHYMDDYLDSAHTKEEALTRINQVIEVHRRGGFEICGWISSSREVFSEIPKHLRSIKHDVDIHAELSIERVLGLQWNPNTDGFIFLGKFNKIDPAIINNTRIPTKREVLSTVMSIFDPLGFLTHFMVRAKILLQDIWRTEIGWDDKLSESCNEKWVIWLCMLNKITLMKIPRPYSTEMIQAKTIQLHVFCDASEKAFAAVAYFRVQVREDVHTALITAKSRVAPLKPLTIPRLELQAALMASRLAKTIKDNHNLKIDGNYFWTDSQTVLYWIQSDARRYKPFVAHRIGEIEELTDAKDWHWVATKDNVADEATRDSNICHFEWDSRWLNGPDFLKLPESEWTFRTKRTDQHTQREDGDELKAEFVCVITSFSDALPDVNRFSSWLRLIRTTAWILRFVSNCRKESERRQTELVPRECAYAESLWWKKVQGESFAEDLKCLTDKRPLKPSSRLLTLSPIIDTDGVLRVRGRTDAALAIDECTKRPVILDPRHPFTKLLVQYVHVQAGHHGQEAVVNELRQKYWILNIRTAVRSAWNSCQLCKNQRARCQVPEMAPLPAVRLMARVRPFTSAGMDFFGPMEVTIGRRREKRYGVLFTCLSVRAVHVEIAASLNTDSAIMAIRRMIARRGSPKEIYSDNGTNLRGSDKELQAALREFDQNKIVTEMTIRKIDWHFIPPATPHMGGSWERLVRSIKVSLNAILKQRAPREEVLQTLFAEAENIVNSRPLTHVSVDPADPESLTPNHFLIGCSSAAEAPGVFNDSDLYLRKQWRAAQRLTDHFWKRWIKEYIPTLTKRTKWYRQVNPVTIGDVVIVADGNMSRNSWPRGIVIKTYPGSDGVVRVVDVKTQAGTYRRPVAKLIVLNVRDEDAVDDCGEPSRGEEC